MLPLRSQARPAQVRSQVVITLKEAEVLARASKKRTKISVKDMRHRNDPMVRLYETIQDWLQDRGRPLVIAVGVLIGAALLYVAGSTFFSWRESKAARAFAEAHEKYSAPVQDATTLTTTPVGKFYTDEKVKWQETAEAFEKLASEYPGYYDQIGRYYAGAAYLHFDPAKGTQLLEQVAAKNDPETSDLARLALGEYHASLGENDKAIEIFEKLIASSPTLKQSAQLRLAQLYEKVDQTERAVESYFEVASADRSTPAGSEAEKRLSALAPDRVKDLPPIDPTSTVVP